MALDDQPLLDEQGRDVSSPTKGAEWQHVSTALSAANVCFITFGMAYAVGTLFGLKTQLIDHLHIDDVEYAAFFSSTSFLSIFMAFGAGVLLDVLGTRWSAVLFSLVCLVVAVGVTCGTAYTSLATILAFRFFAGFGELPLVVAQNTIISKKFSEQASLFLGCAVANQRTAQFLSLFLSAYLADHLYGGVLAPLVVGAACALLSFLAAVTFAMTSREPCAAQSESPAQDSDTDRAVKVPWGWNRVVRVLRVELQHWCSVRYWVLVGAVAMMYSALYPFLAVSSDMLVLRWGISEVDAGIFSSILTLEAIVLTPVFGALVGRVGRRASFAMGGTLLQASGFGLLWVQSIHPVICLAVMGVGISMAPSALWSSVPLTVSGDRLGVAFGITSSSQQIGLVISNLAAGYIKKHTKSYDFVIVYFGAVAGTASLLCVCLALLERNAENAAKQRRGSVGEPGMGGLEVLDSLPPNK